MTRQPHLNTKRTSSPHASDRRLVLFNRAPGLLQGVPPLCSAGSRSAAQHWQTLPPGRRGVGGLSSTTEVRINAYRPLHGSLRCTTTIAAAASSDGLSTEVVIVGGGLAGLAAGVALQKAGMLRDPSSIVLSTYNYLGLHSVHAKPKP